MRVLITGVGGVFGSRVAQMLERRPDVEALAGLDIVAPGRSVRRLEMLVIDPLDRRAVLDAVTRFAPTAVVHLGIYEPDARSTPREAVERTAAGTVAVLGAAAELGTLDRIVVRSGIEVYGRRRGSPMTPDESVRPDPTTSFGRSLLRVEQLAMATGADVGVPTSALRFGPLVGPEFPSPLARLLRMRAVPVSAMADLPFQLLHTDDAARAVVDALERRVDGPVNVVGAGAVTAFQALRMGRRIPLRMLGPEWSLARLVSARLGSPVPDHVLELLQRGRTADGSRAASVLGRAPLRSTPDLARALFTWHEVQPADWLKLVPEEEAA